MNDSNEIDVVAELQRCYPRVANISRPMADELYETALDEDLADDGTVMMPMALADSIIRRNRHHREVAEAYKTDAAYWRKLAEGNRAQSRLGEREIERWRIIAAILGTAVVLLVIELIVLTVMRWF